MEENKIKEIIESSGNDLQFKVKDLLDEKDWNSKLSPYYNDPVTGKSREIDIITKKLFSDKFTIRLFVECKHIKNTILFWFVPKDLESATELAKNNFILARQNDICLKNESIIPHKIHHYIQSNDVARTWEYKGERGSNSDVFYKAFNQALNSLMFFQREFPETNTIDFPLIVVDSLKNLHKREKNKKGYSPIKDNFQLEIDYSYTYTEAGVPSRISDKRYSLVDVIEVDKLTDFLQQLEQNDIALFQGVLGWNEIIKRKTQERQKMKPDTYI